jgi:beta-glucosidase
LVKADFPGHFLWGAATSAYQVEGAIDVDGRGPSIWDRFCTRRGAIADGSTGAEACDQYRRWPDDVALLQRLGLGAYRFSIAWPRIVPDGKGAVSAEGLDHYDRLVDGLLTAGIAPYPTLYHWDLPQPLEDEGGWTVRSTVDAFADYVDVVTRRIGDRVPCWMTLNEPYVSWHHGYVSGIHAPGRRSYDAGLAAAHHLLLAHGRAVEVVRTNAPGSKVGIVLNFTPVTPLSDYDEDVIEAAVVDGIENRWCVEPIAGRGYPAETAAAIGWRAGEVHHGDLETIAAPIDVLGVNYYTRQVVAARRDHVAPTAPVTAMGWEIHPPSFERLLLELHRSYSFPSYLVTENGAAMPDQPDAAGFVQDDDRIDYLHRHLAVVRDVRAAGVPVDGYFVWSLLDNFEWAWGYSARFGIVRVDFETQERVPKASAHWYASLARTGVLPARSELGFRKL